MNSQLKTMIRACVVCEKFGRNNQKEPLIQEETPKYPYQYVSVDIFEYAGHDFLAIYDAYSNYLVSFRTSGKTAKHVIGGMREVFDRIGYPTILKSDNVPFGSAEFDRFASEHNIQLRFSSPRYPQSNGLSEKGVAIAKNIVKRCYESNTVDQFHYKILEYDTTPVASMALTPSQLFFGRLLKTKLPISESLLARKHLPEVEVKRKIENKKEKQKYYYDRTARSLPTLNVGDYVIFKKNSKEWNYGTIAANVNGRSYIVRDGFNNHFRRNRRFIAKSVNTGFEAKDAIFEDNILTNSNNSNNLEKIVVIPPVERVPVTSRGGPDRVNNEVELPMGVPGSSDEYDTAGSYTSGPETDGEDTSPPVLPVGEFKTTRSGRVSRPPNRYGW